jgi:ribonuclease P protein subunit RPR2
MAKEKAGTMDRVPNRQSHARISFLYQAASYFADLDKRSTLSSTKSSEERIEAQTGEPAKQQDDVCFTKVMPKSNGTSCVENKQHKHAVSAFLGLQLRTLSRKSQAKIAQSIKRDICKRCSVILREGKTSATRIENKSYENQKPWADVLVVTCLCCGMEKRYPLGRKKEAITSPKPGTSENT